jgi:hypothetical protein
MLMKAAELVIRTDTVSPGNHFLNRHPVSTDSTTDFQSLLSAGTSPVSSFFTSHDLKVREIRPVMFVKYQPDWILGILLFAFILLAWIQVFYRKRLHQILMAPFSRRFLSQLVRDGDLFSERITLAAAFIYLITSALLIYQLYKLVPVSGGIKMPGGFLLFVLICFSLLAFWTLKFSLIRFLSIIFRTRQTTREYILNILIFNIITGILVLPMLVLGIYLKSVIFLWICIIIFLLFFTFRFARGFLIGISITKFSYLFLFVYLCSLEILPLIVLVRLVLRYCV